MFDSMQKNVDHVVLLMLENRSFDNVLGGLYGVPDDRPGHHIPPLAGGEAVFHGLIGLVVPPPTNALTFGVPKKTETHEVKIGTGEPRPLVPWVNPHEEYEHVNVQLFEKEETPCKRIGDGFPCSDDKGASGEINEATMGGFLQDFYDHVGAATWSWDKKTSILRCFSPEEIPVLNDLAKSFAVCDRWFSSVPTQTNPNRAFVHCGTSYGRVKNLKLSAKETFPCRTIWNVLSKAGVDWALYYHEAWHDKKCFTQYTFPEIEKVHGYSSMIKTIDKFHSDARAGALPAFTFIEPAWGYGLNWSLSTQGNDYHPPSNLTYGEKLVKDIYESLTTNKNKWARTLLIVTFDEHGGTYDHVPPPWTATPPGGPEDDAHEGFKFKFNRYGVRVPTILISPLIEPRTVFRTEGEAEYDHTSILATILGWKNISVDDARLGERVKKAPTFENVLTRSTPRQDIPTISRDLTSPIEIVNETASYIYYYFGWDASIPWVDTDNNYLAPGETKTFDESKDFLNHRYYVGASFYSGKGLLPGAYRGPNNWTTFWDTWKGIGLHQRLVVRGGDPPALTKAGDDGTGTITVVNDTAEVTGSSPVRGAT